MIFFLSSQYEFKVKNIKKKKVCLMVAVDGVKVMLQAKKKVRKDLILDHRCNCLFSK